MRHGRAKAARKTLRYFERAVNLKSRPYYSVLLDATFLIAMVRMTTGEGAESSGAQCGGSPIVSRIERVLQVNHQSGGSASSRDDRLGNFHDSNGSNHNNTNADSDRNHSHSPHYHSNHYGVRFFVPQEAVEELETIVRTFHDRSETTKKKKKKAQYEAKSRVFRDALDWIHRNGGKKKSSSHGHRGGGRCEVLPKLEPLVKTNAKAKKTPQHKPTEATNNTGDETDQAMDPEQEEADPIAASEAVRRHIARDDGREDSNGNTIQNNNSVSRTYIVASQEEDLLDDLRTLGTVPILRCANNASVLILENPSKKGQKHQTLKESSKWKGSLQHPAERALVDAAWKAEKARKHGLKTRVLGGSGNSEREPARGAGKAKGPNPLSCKKRKQSDTASGGVSKSKKRRERAQRNKAAAEGDEHQ